MSKWKIINGNNIDILREYPDNTFDSIVTDPPYGIEFLGKDWDSNTGAMETWEECFRVLKPGGYILAFSAARTYHHLATNIEMAGFEIRDQLMWIYASGFPKAQDMGKAIQKRQGVEEYEKAPRGSYEDGTNRNSYEINAGYKGVMVKPTSPEAQQWSGWKTALKPAHEPIVMARKPFSGSCIDNVLEWGTGAMNIDASRIESEPRMVLTRKEGHNATLTFDGSKESAHKDTSDAYEMVEHNGRYPSNVLGDIPEYQKYFYCPKVSRHERHCGYEQKNIPGIGSQDGNAMGHLPGDKNSKIKDVEKSTTGIGNNHPTVKPVELMKYLIKLVTPPGGRVLDPFNGSGSTGMAAVELGYEYVGCELDPDYVEIANNRITAWAEMHDTPANKLFD